MQYTETVSDQLLAATDTKYDMHVEIMAYYVSNMMSKKKKTIKKALVNAVW